MYFLFEFRNWGESCQRSQKPKNKGAGAFLAPNGKMVEIRDVWAENLDEEMALIRKVHRTLAK